MTFQTQKFDPTPPPSHCGGILANHLVATAIRDSKAAYAMRQAALSGHLSTQRAKRQERDSFGPSNSRVVDGVTPTSLSGAFINRWAVAQAAITVAQCATIYLPSTMARAAMLGCGTPQAQAVLVGLHVGLSFGLPLMTRLGTELVENSWRASLFEGRRSQLVKSLDARPELKENKDFLHIAEQELGNTGLAMDDKTITTAMMVFAAAKPLLLCGLQLAVGMSPAGLAMVGAVTVGALLITHVGDWLSQCGDQIDLAQRKESLSHQGEQLGDKAAERDVAAWSRDFSRQSRSYFSARARHETLDTLAVQLHLLPSLVVDSAQSVARHYDTAASRAPRFMLTEALSELSVGVALFEGTRQFESLRLKARGLGKQLEEHQAKMAESLATA